MLLYIFGYILGYIGKGVWGKTNGKKFLPDLFFSFFLYIFAPIHDYVEKYQKNIQMSEKDIQLVKELDREKLEELTISLWDDMHQSFINEVFNQKPNKYTKYLESENERLTKAVSGIYQDIKMKSLRFFIDAKPTDEQRDIFANLFRKYLK